MHSPAFPQMWAQIPPHTQQHRPRMPHSVKHKRLVPHFTRLGHRSRRQCPSRSGNSRPSHIIHTHRWRLAELQKHASWRLAYRMCASVLLKTDPDVSLPAWTRPSWKVSGGAHRGHLANAMSQRVLTGPGGLIPLFSSPTSVRHVPLRAQAPLERTPAGDFSLDSTPVHARRSRGPCLQSSYLRRFSRVCLSIET
ncbi:hypothetical protein BD413DRAFT_191580 [Trametes elegans]|nr:hypothetical protein BD413DRAFT_191580 [Trametes elegans]